MIRRSQVGTVGTLRLLTIVTGILLVACAAIVVGSGAATAAPPQGGEQECAAGVDLLGFSDTLDKTTFRGTSVGGLSGITYDAQRDVYYALVDNQGTTASRFYTLRLKTDGKKVRKPKVLDVTILKDEDGTPFTGANFDGEGIALTPDGKLLVSSETEPSIRRFALDGTYLGDLAVPERFLVQGGGGNPTRPSKGSR